jgi:hypothetical protein
MSKRSHKQSSSLSPLSHLLSHHQQQVPPPWAEYALQLHAGSPHVKYVVVQTSPNNDRH